MLRIQLDQAIQQKTIRQLLENARTRIEEEEYPLAMQKIQEILEIDPQHVDALHMKAEVEKRRSEKQVDQWYRLVHQHIGNQLFSQARQGLEEILRLRPSDVQAHALLAQVDQQEKESINSRKEKEQLYESALHCYHQGEISTALDKLERVLALSRQSPGAENAEKEAQYQSLYKQIRSEREAFRNAYAEARRHLEENNFDRVLAFCAEFLKKNPSDPLFQALKLEAEERERQELSAAVVDVGRRVEAEADLDRQISILKEATQRYPKEPHFQDNLKLIRERRDLVNSIVNKAIQYEQRSQFSEALGQWDILRNIYRRYPGLDVEIERLARRRDEQSREETKARWVRQIDQRLEMGDYDKAQACLREALVEFPGDRELTSLEKLVAQGTERRTEAERHFEEGKKLGESGDFDKAISCFRKAKELDTRNRTIRAALLNALLDYGRTLLNKDWPSAKPFIQEALQLEESNPVARSLFAQLQDQERQAQVDTCVCEARDLQATSDVQGALFKVQALLKKYPNDMRLSQLETTLLNSLHADPNHAHQTPKTPPSTPKRNRLSSAGDAPAPHDEAQALSTGVEAQPARRDADAGAVETSIGSSVPAPVLSNQPGSSNKKQLPLLKQWQWACIALVPILIVTAIYFVLKSRVATHPKPGDVPVELQANVEGVKFTIDGRSMNSGAISLEAGKEYVIEASHEGYQTEVKRLTPSTTAAGRIEFTLAALSPELRFSSDLKKGQVSIGEQRPVSLQSGEFGPEQLASGSITFKVLRRGRVLLELPLNIQPGKAAALSGSMQTKDCSVVVVSILGNSARVYASPELKGSSGKLPLQAIPPDGLAVDTATAGPEFNLSDGRSLTIQPANAPALMVSLSTSGASGTLQIQANVLQAQVKIDGKIRKDPMLNGSKTVLLETGKHRIQVIAPRYANSEEREVYIQERKTTKEVFTLSSDPTQLQAQLYLEDAEPGAAVYVDGEQRGTIPDNGSLMLDVSPGERKIVLKKSTYEDSPTITRQFKPKRTETVSGKQFPLIKNGSLTFNVTPATATITLRSGNELPKIVRANEIVFLKKGTYTYAIEADYFATVSGTSPVEPNKSTSIGLSLQAAEPQNLAEVDLFENPSQWSRRDNWWVLKKSDYGWLKPRNGSFSVIIEKPHSGMLFGKKKVEWTLDYRGEGDKIIYSASGKTLSRQVVTAGSPASNQFKAQFTERPDTYHFIFEISPTRIVVRDNGGNLIDEVKRSDPTLDLGKIGFRGEMSITVQQLR